MKLILFVYVVFFLLRLFTLFVSVRNEKKIVQQGAVQCGKKNSTCLMALHVLFFLAALIELLLSETAELDFIRWIGILLFLFSHAILWMVIYQLGGIWTVKIYILKKHPINHSFLFKYFRHPNYYLSVLPELFGVGMLCKSWFTMAVILPIYFVVLAIRIRQEEKAMEQLL